MTTIILMVFLQYYRYAEFPWWFWAIIILGVIIHFDSHDALSRSLGYVQNWINEEEEQRET